MRVVGLTGGIGSGKSTVARMLAARGATIVDADRIAKAVVEPGTDGLAAIAARWPEVVVDGALDRRALGRIVFGDDEARAALNAIVHPRVAARTAQAIAAAAEARAPLIVYDVPLLYENGLETQVAEVIVVFTSDAHRRERIRARDDLSDEEIEGRIAAQLPLEEKVRRADHVIDNDGSLEATEHQVDALYEKLTREDAK
ncbi:MAG: dephospho-CoA kinase [Deltaproteobacteria bacterium]